MDADELRILGNVVECARTELRDTDADDVPSSLRTVAKSSARVLPAPLARSVLTELVRNSTFRSSVHARWKDEGLKDAVGLAFLADPDGSLDLVARTSLKRKLELQQDELRDAELRCVSLDEQLREAKRRLKQVRNEHSREISDLATKDDERRESLLRSRTSANADLRDAERHVISLEETNHDLLAEVKDLENRLRRGIDRERRRSSATGEVKNHNQHGPPGDSLALAIWLDTVERNQRSYRVAARLGPSSSDDEPLSIPEGIAPDSREAIAALVSQHPSLIVIDGYNVAGLITNGPLASASNRTSVVSKAERLGAVSRSRVVVVFDALGADATPEIDGTLIEEGVRSLPSHGEVAVRFSMDQSADDLIVDIIHAKPARSVVVTNDRELRERCVADGCVTVWSSAFVDWSIP